MKSKLSDLAKEGLAERHLWSQPVRVPLRAYVEFCRRMDEQLQKLVARWADPRVVNQQLLRRRGIQ